MTGIWRWGSRLPDVAKTAHITLGEGDTPLIDVSRSFGSLFNGATVLLKAEHLNPTGSFKDRVAAVAAGLVVSLGLQGAVGTSSGNGGAAIAAYAAAAGFPAVLLTLPDAPAAKLRQIRAAGARVLPVEGLGYDARNTRMVAEEVTRIARDQRWLAFLTGGRFAAEIMTGAKTIAYELAEQVPHASVVYAPVGGGGLAASLARGYDDLDPVLRPTLRFVQPRGNATVRAALNGEHEDSQARSTTNISGLQVAILFDDVTHALRTEKDALVEIDDDDAATAQALLASAGVLLERAGATALAGALRDAGRYGPDDTIVAVATGAGWKTPDDFAAPDAAPALLGSVGELSGILGAYGGSLAETGDGRAP